MTTFASRKDCFVARTGGHRITREEVITLRKITLRKETWTHKLTQVIHECCEAAAALFSTPVMAFASGGANRTNTMCKNYGHVIQGPWHGYYPKCRDCGCEIKSPDELRKATAR